MNVVKIFTACLRIFGVFCLSVISTSAQENSPPDDATDNPPARVARISYLKGSVSFQPAGQDQWSEASLNFTVTRGDRIYTDRDSRAELQVGPYSVRLSEKTDLEITNLDDQTMQLGLEQGTLRVSIYQVALGNTIEVDTPNGALSFLDAGSYRADVDPGGGATVISVNAGSLEVTAAGASQTLHSGGALRLVGHDSVEAMSVPLPRLDGFDKWSEERDQRISSAASSRYVSRDTPGFEELDAYGRWEEVADHGPIWYPNAVAADWVPYRYGHWAWVGPWGWTWVEDEPWGFCPFHYGRWVHVGAAWGWLPGPIVAVPVYAPALVAFVGGPHFAFSIAAGNIGLTAWFPLGPGEPYFPWYHCRPEYITRVNITNIRNVTNITNITQITNINNVHYAYRTVATTAVPAHVFSSGQHVAHQAVRLRPQDLERAQVVPHPGVNPTTHAALPGKPVSPPPVRTVSLAATRGATAVRRPVASAREMAPSTGAVPKFPPGVAPRSPRGLITKSPTPPPPVPYARQRQPMLSHPGRPLEPRQLENLRAGRPAGRISDKEFPPHLRPVPTSRSAPPPRIERRKKSTRP